MVEITWGSAPSPWAWTPLTVSTLLTLLALAVAVWGTVGARKDAREAREARDAAEARERAAAAEREAARRREQPAKIAVWRVISTEEIKAEFSRSKRICYRHHAVNRSDLPVNNLSASYVEEDLRGVDIGTLGPGQSWEGTPLYYENMHPDPDWWHVVGWNFTDATGREWNGGTGPLVDVTEAIYGDVPQGYSHGLDE